MPRSGFAFGHFVLRFLPKKTEATSLCVCVHLAIPRVVEVVLGQLRRKELSHTPAIPDSLITIHFPFYSPTRLPRRSLVRRLVTRHFPRYTFAMQEDFIITESPTGLNEGN